MCSPSCGCLWLADRSPSLSHIPLLSVLSLVCLAVPLLLASGCLFPLLVPAPGLPGLGCRVASGVACACLRLGLGLGLLPCCPLYASSSMPIDCGLCVPPCPGLGLLPCSAVCPGYWATPSAVPCPFVWSRYLTLSPWCGCGGLAAGCGGSGCARWLPRVGCLDPGHE